MDETMFPKVPHNQARQQELETSTVSQAREFSAWVHILWTSGNQKPTDRSLYVSDKEMLTSMSSEMGNGTGMKPWQRAGSVSTCAVASNSQHGYRSSSQRILKAGTVVGQWWHSL